MGSVYWFHSIVAPCMCACLVLCLFSCQVGSQWIICQKCYALGIVNGDIGGICLLWNRQKNDKVQTWQSYEEGLTIYISKNGLVKNILWQEFMRYGTLHIDTYLFFFDDLIL